MVCANLPAGDRDHCYQKLAVESNNIKYCDEIEQAGPASKCYIFLAEKNSYYCGVMEQMPWYGKPGAYDSATCYQNIAQKTKFSDYCIKIPDGYSSSGNDLAPGGVSVYRCFSNLGCGLPGESPCRTSYGEYNCLIKTNPLEILEFSKDGAPSPFECPSS
ncbi:MAG: hypothetical protein JXA08_04495 [Methanomicrobiaceae archaeon]|nr:hypothetical protein [Methanomicrobiaceae archaeon]